LSITCSGKTEGVQTKASEFFKLARRSDLLPEASAVDKSAVTKARKKLPWESFETLLNEAVQLAYESFPVREEYRWNGLSVFAFDGSKYTLPATQALRDEFDPESGFEYDGKEHYPQCLVTTLYDVFRRLPIARFISSIPEGNEREEAAKFFHVIPADSISLFDRGYPSFSFFETLNLNCKGFYAVRCPASSTFPAVEAFVQSGEKESTLWIDPSNNYLKGLTAEEKKQAKAIKLRCLRLVSPEGEVSVLLTNLFDKRKYKYDEIIALYFKRWAVEDHYRHEKCFLAIETFHSQSVNGIKQELYAVLVTSVIARTITALSVDSESRETEKSTVSPQLKNAVISFAKEAALLIPKDPEKAFKIFEELIETIRRIKYYKPKKIRLSAPRITKKAKNKWQNKRQNKLSEDS